MKNKQLNYIVYDVNDKVRKSYISNLVATSANQKVFVFNDADITTESTAYRSYARIKRADSFNVGPITLLASEITVENTGYTQDELNKFLESINVDYTSCRILILEKQALAVSGPISITVVYDRVNELGRTIETQAKAEVSAYVYNAVEEIFTEEEYNTIKEEMLPRDLGDITDSDTEITNAVKFLGKQSGFTKLLPVNLIRDYIGKYNVIDLGAIDSEDIFDTINKRGVYRYEFDDGPFGYAGLLINAKEDGDERTQMMMERDYVKYRTKPEGASEYNEWKTFKFDEIHKLIEEGIINGTLESFIEDKVLDKVDEINPRLLNVEQNKADKTALQAVASGSPKGVYPSLTELTAANPDPTYTYITMDNGHWNYWNGSAWVSGGVYQATKVQEGSITPDELNSDLLSLITQKIVSKNIYDKTLAKDNTFNYNSSGTEGYSTEFCSSGPVPVDELQTYTISILEQTLYCLYYFNNGTYIGYDIKCNNKLNYTFTTPENTTHVVANINMPENHDSVAFQNVINGLQIELGIEQTEYEPYATKLFINDEANTAINEIDKIKLLLETSSKNKYNKSLAVDGQYYNTNNGSQNPTANSAITGKIPVLPRRQYTLSIDANGSNTFMRNIFYWDINGNYVGRDIGNRYWDENNKYVTFWVPDNCYYVGANFLWQVPHTHTDFVEAASTIQLESGPQVTPYEAYEEKQYLKIDGFVENPVARFKDKKIMCFGDSITYGTMGGYVHYIQTITGANVINLGSSGATTGRLLAIMTPVKDRSDVVVVDTPDYTDVAAVTIMIGRNQTLSGSITDIPSGPEISIDRLPFVYNGIAVETEEDYWNLFQDNFVCNVAMCIEYVKFKNPMAKIYLITPPISTTDINATNNLKNVRNAIMDLGDFYSVPVIDAQNNAGMDVKHFHKYTYDGTHLNFAGNKLIGEYIAYQILYN